MNILLLPKHTLFICDTHVNLDLSAELTLLGTEEMRYFGLVLKGALPSQMASELEVDGEMHGVRRCRRACVHNCFRKRS